MALALTTFSGVARADRRDLCFVGRAECSLVLLAEATNGVARRPSDEHPATFQHYFTVDFGALLRVNAHFGVGFSFGFTPFAGDQYSTKRFVRARGRYWLSDVWATDLSIAGYSTPMSADNASSTTGYRIDAALVLVDHLGIVVGFDRNTPRVYDKTTTSPYLAFRFGGAALPFGVACGAIASD